MLGDQTKGVGLQGNFFKQALIIPTLPLPQRVYMFVYFIPQEFRFQEKKRICKEYLLDQIFMLLGFSYYPPPPTPEFETVCCSGYLGAVERTLPEACLLRLHRDHLRLDKGKQQL